MIEKKSELLSPRSIQISSNHRFNHQSAASPSSPVNEFLLNKYDKRRQTDNGLLYAETPQDKPERSISRKPHYSGSTNLGEDVRDALREFDYLNDYDESSVRNDSILQHNPTAIYHF